MSLSPVTKETEVFAELFWRGSPMFSSVLARWAPSGCSEGGKATRKGLKATSLIGGEMTAEEYGSAYKKGYVRTVRLLVTKGLSWDGAQEAAQAAWVKGWEKR